MIQIPPLHELMQYLPLATVYRQLRKSLKYPGLLYQIGALDIPILTKQSNEVYQLRKLGGIVLPENILSHTHLKMTAQLDLIPDYLFLLKHVDTEPEKRTRLPSILTAKISQKLKNASQHCTTIPFDLRLNAKYTTFYEKTLYNARWSMATFGDLGFENCQDYCAHAL